MELRPDLPPLPERMRHLPVDHRGFPVPWFVQWVDGEPEFRAFDTRKFIRAVNHKLCWVCGGKLGKFMAFVLGPMCAVNRVISEPPSHRECALFSATGCPFLSRPRMRRNNHNLPDGMHHPAGYHLERNPGACCVWITRSYEPFRCDDGDDGILIRIGEPVETLWFCQGKPATRYDVMRAILDGLTAAKAAMPIGEEEVALLRQGYAELLPFLPRATQPGDPSDASPLPL